MSHDTAWALGIIGAAIIWLVIATIVGARTGRRIAAQDQRTEIPALPLLDAVAAKLAEDVDQEWYDLNQGQGR